MNFAMPYRFSPLEMVIIVAILVGSNAITHAQVNDGYSFTILSDPSATAGTFPTAVSDGTTVGYYASGFDHGFSYDGSAFVTLDYPQATLTQPMGISAGTIVGHYRTNLNGPDNGFVYNGSMFTTLNDPAGSGTDPTGVSGNLIVGNDNGNGFVYNGSTFTTISDPQATDGTFVTGISGNNIVGYFMGSNSIQGFIYNGSTYTAINDPVSPDATYVTGISGNLIVGYYPSGPGPSYNSFIYNGSTFTTITDPLATGTPSVFFPVRTQISGISEDGTIVGTFQGDDLSAGGGFIATPVVPEPASCALLAGAGCLLLRRRHPRRWV